MKSLAILAALTAIYAAAIPAAEACSARGRYCGYPTWAANAFEGPTGQKPVAAEKYLPASPKRGR